MVTRRIFRTAVAATGSMMLAAGTMSVAATGALASADAAAEQAGAIAPEVRQSVRNDTSAPLAELAAAAAAPRAAAGVAEQPMRGLPREAGLAGDRAAAAGSAAVGSAAPGGLMPAFDDDFEGVGNVNGVFPPDTNGDVGPNHYMQWVNLSLAVWDKQGNLLLGPVNGNTLFAGFGGPCQNTNNGDPIVLYDHLADRWLASQFAFPNGSGAPPYFQCIAISATGDPTGSWHRYEFQIPVDKINDYPKFGVWPDAYYMAVNEFTPAGVFAGQGTAAFDRDAMLAGLPAQMIYFDLFSVNPAFGGQLPADLDGTPPPAGTPNYFVEADDSAVSPFPTDRLSVWEFHVDFDTPTNSTFGVGGQPNYHLDTAAFDMNLCNFARSCIDQPATAVGLDAISDRLMYRLQYRSFDDHASLVVNHSVDVDGTDHAGVRWYELRDVGAGFTIHQQGTHAPDAENRWMGSAAMDVSGNIAVGYSVSSETTFPSIRAAGRLAGDPPGPLTQGETEMIAGGGAQTDTRARWGDYSMLAVDPVDQCTFWYTTEYLTTTSAASWHTRIGHFTFPTCTAGPAGTLTGTVTDADTGDPIADATVTAGAFSTETTADGSYTFILPVGSYDMTAAAFGYETATATGVQVLEDQTTTQSFTLQPVPRATVSGTVNDGSGHDWPLYAKITVQGVPDGTIYTDPATGGYAVELPANATYEFAVEPLYPGYVGATETVEVGTDDVVRDIQLLVDPFDCRSAPGYRLDQPSMAMITSLPAQFQAYFASLGIQVDFYTVSQLAQVTGYDVVMWAYNSSTVSQAAFDALLATTDAEGTGVLFLDHAFTTWNGIKTLSRLTGQPVSVSTNTGGTGQDNLYEVTQAHPILDGFAVGDQIIHEPGLTGWLAWFEGYEGEGRQIIANVGRTTDGIFGAGIGIQERPNNRHVLMSVHSQSATRGPDDWSAEGEQIFFNALQWASPGATFECVPVPGGLVLGNVHDLNTGAGIDGATVTSDDNPEETTTSFATPDDPGLDDGFYWMFSSLTGSHPFTASAGNYAAQTAQADVLADAANELNFSLPAGLLTVDPTALEATLRLGRSTSRTFTVTNEGTALAEVELLEQSGTFEILRPDGTRVGEQEILSSAGAEVRRVDVPVSDLSAAADGAVGGLTPAPNAPPWQDIANYPIPIMDNIADTWDGKVYSVSGLGAGRTGRTETFSYDPVTGAWTEMASITTARERPDGAIIDGKFYVVGGWDTAGVTVPSLEIYDIASDTWSTGAPIPNAWAASANVVLDGKLYLVGGCQAACGTSEVWVYDPAADGWSAAAPYPEQGRWTQCGAIDGLMYCAGSSLPSANAYVYDPATDAWNPIAPMPTAVWGASYVAANGQLLISGGIIGGAVSNEGFAYDPATDTWSDLPASNSLVYRGAGACGFYKVGGSTGGFTPVPNSELLPGLEECVAEADVPWLSIDPVSATLQPGDSVVVTVSMDANVAQPGTYTAGVRVKEDTPYPVDQVDVTMIVNPPNRWGKITGVVESVDCDGVSAPLPGAIVQIDGGISDVTLTTAADGTYAYWLDVRNNPLTLIVASDGHIPQTRQAGVIPRKTVVEDFALQQIC